MDKNTVFSGLQAQKSDHLKPLSLPSRVISYDPKNTHQPPTSPFINFKIEILTGSKKRKLKDVDSDETCEVPARKPVCLRALSPDPGYFVDFGSTLGTQDCSIAGSSSTPLDIKSGTGNNAESPTHEPCFDKDIDGILSLNPLSTAVHKEAEGQVEGKDEGYFSLSYVRGPVLEGLSSTDEVIGGYEQWDIGPPLLESSICVKDEQVIKDQAEVVEPDRECQATLSRDDSQDTSYEASLPLQVKVKSVVVAVSNSESTQRPQPEQSRRTESNTSQRPEVFRNKADWEREKRLYVHLVTRHINENPAAGQDVMSELQSLMTHVADKTRRSSSNRWQHPTDLTRRNYQRRFGNTMPTLSLREWQAKSNEGHKRFANVPKNFERSPFP